MVESTTAGQGQEKTSQKYNLLTYSRYVIQVHITCNNRVLC